MENYGISLTFSHSTDAVQLIVVMKRMTLVIAAMLSLQQHSEAALSANCVPIIESSEDNYMDQPWFFFEGTIVNGTEDNVGHSPFNNVEHPNVAKDCLRLEVWIMPELYNFTVYSICVTDPFPLIIDPSNGISWRKEHYYLFFNGTSRPVTMQLVGCRGISNSHPRRFRYGQIDAVFSRANKRFVRQIDSYFYNSVILRKTSNRNKNVWQENGRWIRFWHMPIILLGLVIFELIYIGLDLWRTGRMN